MATFRRIPPLILAAAALAGCKSAAPAAPADDGQLPAAVVEPAPAAAPADTPADALARRVEAFTRALQTAPAAQPGPGESAAMAPASSPQTAAPAAAGEPAAVVHVTRNDAATSVVEPLPAAAPPPVVRATPTWDDAPAADRRDPSPAAPSLQDALARRVRDHPASAADVLDYELVRLLDGGAGPQLAAASAEPPAVTSGDLGGEDQRILGAVRDGLERFRRTLRQGESGPAPLPSEKIQPLLEMARNLRREVGLTLPTVALCGEVRLFGSYEPLPTTFAVGRQHLAILYVEVDGFASRETTGAEWETKMALSATLYDPDGRPVLTLPEAQAVDRARGRRRDFYLCSYLTLPADAKPGPHTLKITVRDEISRRIAQQSLKLNFVAEK